MQTDGWADRHDEANRHCAGPCKRTYNSLLVTLSVYVLMYLYFEQQTDNSYEAIQLVSIVDVTHLTPPKSINVLTM